LPSTIEKLKRQRDGQPFTIVAVDIEETPERVADWVRGAGVTVPVLLDKDGAVARAYKVTATPTVLLIGRDGRAVGRGVGTRPWDGPTGRKLLDALIVAPGK
jgi:Redoxin